MEKVRADDAGEGWMGTIEEETEWVVLWRLRQGDAMSHSCEEICATSHSGGGDASSCGVCWVLSANEVERQTHLLAPERWLAHSRTRVVGTVVLLVAHNCPHAPVD